MLKSIKKSHKEKKSHKNKKWKGQLFERSLGPTRFKFRSLQIFVAKLRAYSQQDCPIWGDSSEAISWNGTETSDKPTMRRAA